MFSVPCWYTEPRAIWVVPLPKGKWAPARGMCLGDSFKVGYSMPLARCMRHDCSLNVPNGVISRCGM